MTIDFEAEGLLDGVEGDARAARLELLERLSSEGVSLEELHEAVAAARLTLLPVERALAGDGPRYTPREISELSGVDLDLLQRATAAIGIPYPGSRQPDAHRGRARRGPPRPRLPRCRPARGRHHPGRADDRDRDRADRCRQPGADCADDDAAGRHRARPCASLRRGRRVSDAADRADLGLRAARPHARAGPPRRDRRRRPRLRGDPRHRRLSRSASPTSSSSQGSARRSPRRNSARWPAGSRRWRSRSRRRRYGW